MGINEPRGKKPKVSEIDLDDIDTIRAKTGETPMSLGQTPKSFIEQLKIQ